MLISSYFTLTNPELHSILLCTFKSKLKSFFFSQTLLLDLETMNSVMQVNNNTVRHATESSFLDKSGMSVSYRFTYHFHLRHD